MQKKSFYITTTLPYVNAPLHIGHALEFVRADAIARYKKLIGYEVFFNTGADEHGQKVFLKAKESGKPVEEFVDENFQKFKQQVASFGILNDVHFIRTTDKNHIAAAQEFWRRCDKNGFIYKKKYQTKYCIDCEEEKTDSELVNGRCPIHPNLELEVIDEENYFFKLSALQENLLDFYKKNPSFIVPEFRFNEVRAFVERGLHDFSISRLKEKMSWGIPVPDDGSQVMYVWFDALTNYISTLGWPEESQNLFEKFWVNGTPTQYCGKDNTRFQGLIWQAMLIAAGLPNSHQIIVNGHVTADAGIKMSKSLGNVIEPSAIAEEYGTDALRCFLLAEISSFEDSPFTMERFKDAYNSKLANGLGNLSSRVLALSEKYLEKCPEIPEKSDFTEYFKFYDSFDIQKASDFVWKEIQSLDKYIQETEAFKVIKLDEAKGKSLITEYVVRLYIIARMLNPLMPKTNELLKSLIKENKKPERPLFLRKD